MGRRRRRRRCTVRVAAPHRRPLRIEPLEDRRLLALATVTTLDDTIDFADGVTSLREAIFATNTVAGADTIEFAASLSADGPATILLTLGELAITDSLTINGPGANLLMVDAGGNDPTPDVNNGDGSRVFNIADGNIGTFIDVAVVGVTITEGDVTGAGGGILSEENLAITGCVLTASNATTTGGGISHRLGSLSLVASEVSHNTAASNGGGLVVSANNTPANVGKLVIRQSQINDNSAMFDGGGIHLNQSSRLEIEESEIVGNTAGRNGGGIFVASAGLGLSDSIVAENHATAGSGGGLYGGSTVNLQVFQTLVRNNTSSGGGGGIAIVSGLAGTATSSALLVRDSLLLGNSAAADGGGISLAGGIHALVNSTIAGNMAGVSGGGVSNGSQTATAATAEMMQVTISGNRAGNRGGGVIGGEGTKITRSTIAENVANSDGVGGGNGGGVYSVFGSPGIVVDQTIIGNNQLFNTSQDWYGESGPEVTRSLIEKSAGTLGGYVYGNMVGLDPKLGPLEDNGGPIFLDGSQMLTHALLADSPAIDAGDPTGGTAALAAAYRATVLGDVPSYYYRFEETSSFDSETKEEVTALPHLAATYSGGPTRGVVGAIPGGVAVEFDGVNDFVRSKSTSLTIGPKATVEIWARSATETWNASGWIARSDVKNLFVINPIQGTKSWSALLYDTTNVAHVVGTFTPDAAVDIRQWHQFALSWDQTTGAATMYFDGVAVAANTITAALPQASIVQVLTGWNDNSSTPAYGLGAVDELVLYNHVLSADAIAEHYQVTRLGMFDQRGEMFTRVIDGDGVSGPRVDIGAVERPPGETYQLVVDTLVDENDGDHSTGHFSLREAIAVAQANFGTATIEFAPALTAGGPATILLTQGELLIADSLTIHGPGAHLLTIDATGNDPTPDSTLNDGITANDGDGSRVLNIDDKTSALRNVEIIGLRLTGGDANQDGGGVVARENLTLRECIVSGNTSKSYGGGIFSGTTSYSSSSNSLTVVDCVVADNATGHEGGGIRKVVGSLTVDRSVIDGNQAGAVGGGISAADLLVQVVIRDSVIRKNKATNSSSFGGGGIFLYDAVATISNTSVVENESSSVGGIQSVGNNGGAPGITPGIPRLTIINSTVSGNIARTTIGGIYAQGLTYISHSTVANNSLGGIRGIGLQFSATHVYSTIVAGNSSPGSFESGGYNLINSSSNGIIGPLFGSGGHVFLDGSRMPMHALLAGSPAIDAGNPADMAGVGNVPLFDQRGVPFSRVENGDAVGVARIDIGAYERHLDEELSFVVDTLADEHGDDYSPGDRSLRQAIELANAHPGVDTITFHPDLASAGPGTISLQFGEMVITEPIVIDGPGAKLITVDAHDQSRIFNITATSGDFEIDGLTLTGGKTTGNQTGGPTPNEFSGGAIRSMSLGTLTLNDAWIKNSRTTGERTAGGGIFAAGNVDLNHSVVSGNATMGFSSYGGGVAANLDVTLVESVIAGNSTAGLAAPGGGIRAARNVVVHASVIRQNSTQGDSSGGGGIRGLYVSVFESAILSNSTAGNSANGGGILGSSVTVVQSTVADNSTSGLNSYGAGISTFNGGGVMIVHTTVTNNRASYGWLQTGGGLILNSIIAKNGLPSSPADVQSHPAVNYSLIGATAGVTVTGVGNILNQDPLLGPLVYNGGPVFLDGSRMLTHALLPGSPALDAGDPAAVAGMNGVPEFDQRGMGYGRVVDGDGAGGARIDMGAYERQSGETYNFVVDTLADESDGNYSAGDFSLREAIELANANPGADAIEFDPALTAGGPATILLSLGQLAIADAVTIDGPGANLLTVDASGNDPTPLSTLDDGDATNDGDGSRVFNVDDGTVAAIVVGIDGLSLTGGDAVGDGGGVYSKEDLTIADSVVLDNIAAHGGGVHSSVGTLNVQRTAVRDNSAFFDGGGIVGLNGDVVVADSTISGNATNESGGGIEAYVCDLTVTGSTISGNSAGFDGGGIDVVAGSLQISQSTVSDNEAGRHGGGIIGGLTSASESPKVLTQVTLSGNRAKGMGGGLVGGEHTEIRHSTIVNNVADSDGSGSFFDSGGGVFGGTGIVISHSILANNLRFNTAEDFNGEPWPIVSYSLIEAKGTPWTIPGTGNVLGMDPMLGPLAANGGPTRTHALLSASPAIDAGDPAAVAGMGGVPAFDQRGMPWLRVANGDDVPEARIDMGAVEWQANPLEGDYNFNGVVDAADYSVWRDTLGSTNDLRADGSGATVGMPDGVVDSLDYEFWKANFGNVLAVGSGASVMALEPPADPEAGYPAGVGARSAVMTLLPFDATIVTRKPPADPEAGYPAGAEARVRVTVQNRDDALLAWLARRGGTPAIDVVDDVVERDAGAKADSADDVLDDVFAGLGCEL